MLRPQGDLKDREMVAAELTPSGNCDMLTAEQVAGVVSGIGTIGRARDALTVAGSHAAIAGNRITIDERIFAQFIGATSGVYGSVGATWVVYWIDGTPPVWVVGAGV
jgi:hypothetical protein